MDILAAGKGRQHGRIAGNVSQDAQLHL